MGRLDGKVAVVTGAARGMGAAIARRFAQEGAKVVLGDILEDEAQVVAASIGEGAVFGRLDVTSLDDWDAIVDTAVSRFGGLDVLVNAAGVVRRDPVIDGNPEVFREAFEVNLWGTYLGVRACAKVMAANGGGSIVNISSMQGITGMPWVSAYVASKFGVRGFTKAAAVELARQGVRLNSIHPGFVDTPMLWGNARGDRERYAAQLCATVPLGRLGSVDDIAALALFLASDESAYCTGAEVAVDGGILAGAFAPTPVPGS